MLSTVDIVKFTYAYIVFRTDPENDDVTDAMWCGQNGINVREWSKVLRESKDVHSKILDGRRKEYVKLLKEVDTALFNKAKSGDYKAAELVYRRFEAWSPKQADAAPGTGQKTFADLIAEEE